MSTMLMSSMSIRARWEVQSQLYDRSILLTETGTRLLKKFENFARGTTDPESKTWIISSAKRNTNSRFSTFSFPPPQSFGDHLSYLVHLPVILLVHHYLNHHLTKMAQQPILSLSNIGSNSNIPCTTLPTLLGANQLTLGISLLKRSRTDTGAPRPDPRDTWVQ